jgi:mono/diheme cytochrome c family protein
MQRGILISMVLVAMLAAGAEGGERVPPVANPVVTKECGSCHMAFPPQFLPQRSWRRLVAGLSDHFGENASLGEAQLKAVLDYLLANAADAPGASRQVRTFAQGIPPAQAPLRITETPRWVKEHREIGADRWRAPDVRSKANCVACHRAAEQGVYED